MNGKIVALTMAATMLAGQALASEAQISSVNGAVLASRSGQFTAATPATTLKTGDRVVTREGSAQVSFSDGCVVSVKPQAMLTIGATSPCVGGAGLVTASDGASAQFGMKSSTGMGPAVVSFVALSTALLLWHNNTGDDPTSP